MFWSKASPRRPRISSTPPWAAWRGCRTGCSGRSTSASSRSTGWNSRCVSRYPACAPRCGERKPRATARSPGSTTRRWSPRTSCSPSRLARLLLRLRRPVDHRGGGCREVIQQRYAHRGRKGHRFDSRGHVAEPRIAFDLADCKRPVPHPQARVAALLAVRRRPAPVLDQEEGQALGRGGKVLLGINRAQHGVDRDARVEAVHQETESGLAARELKHTLVQHRAILLSQCCARSETDTWARSSSS